MIILDMFFFRVLIFLILMLKIKSENLNYEDSIGKLDKRLEITFYGYQDISNERNEKPCSCFEDPITKNCKLCVHSLYLQLKKSDIGSYNDILIKKFDTASNRINERFQFVQFFNSQEYDSFNLAMNSVYRTKEYIEIWPKEISTLYCKLFYEEIYGQNRKITVTYKIILRPTNVFLPFRYFLLRIDSLTWKNYKDINSTCCKTILNENVCDSTCDFSINLLVNDIYQKDSQTFSVENKGNYFSNMHLIVKDDYIFKNKITISLKFFDEIREKIIDEYILSLIRLSPNTITIGKKKLGTYGNLITNISYQYVCNYYQSVNCMELCTNVGSTNMCAIIDETMICENGAIDPPICLEYSKNCSDIICQNGGNCVEYNKIFGCICPKEYTGKFCEKYNCECDCNKNGVCIGYNKCNCTFPFEGDECDISPCNASAKNPCNQNYSCQINKGKIVCFCPDIFTGHFCETPVCKNNCLFGVCKYNQQKNTTMCECNKPYKGELCDEYIQPLKFSKYKEYLIIALTCIIALNAAQIIIFFLLNKLVNRSINKNRRK